MSLPTLAALVAFASGAAAPVPPPEASAAVSTPARSVNLGPAIGTPASMGVGLALGVAAEGRRSFGGAFFLSARLGWGLASEASTDWLISHHQGSLSLGAGLERTTGVAHLFLQGGLGGVVVYDTESRHQLRRYEAMGLPGGTRTGWTVGPLAFGEAGVELAVAGPFSLLVAGGPLLQVTKVDDARHVAVGGATRLGVACAF